MIVVNEMVVDKQVDKECPRCAGLKVGAQRAPRRLVKYKCRRFVWCERISGDEARRACEKD